MDGTEGDDEQYPSAPLPAHERVWRHPSEVGHAAWVGSEPPLAIGRGLTIASGAIGVVLAIAVLWAVLPTRAGTSGITVGATSPLPSISTLAAATHPALTTLPAATSPTDAPTTNSLDTITSVPVLQVLEGADDQPYPLAVAIGDGSLIVTTAKAVLGTRSLRPDAAVALLLAGGDTERLRLLMVDEHQGLAILENSGAFGGAPLPMARAVAAGEQLTFIGEHPANAVVGADGTIDTGYPVSSMREGTPVVNAHGELVALVTRGAHGVEVVRLAGLAIFDEFLATQDHATGPTLPAP